jgi:hypothetical protein
MQFLLMIIIAGVVLMIVGLLFKKNRNDKEYVGTIKSVVGNLIWIYVGIPICFIIIIVVSVYFAIQNKPNYSTTRVESSGNRTSQSSNDRNNRLVSGDEQREIASRVSSGQSPEEVSAAMSGKNVDGYATNIELSDVFIQSPYYKIRFPKGWKISKEADQQNNVLASNEADGSYIRLIIDEFESKLTPTPELAKKLANQILTSTQKQYPKAEILEYKTVNMFGRTGIFAKIGLSDVGFIAECIVPVNNRFYDIKFGGRNESLDSIRYSLNSLSMLD